MKKSTYKKFGLFSSISIVISSVVGIGIFFKNASVFTAANGTPWVILTAWIIGAIIAILMAFSFIEISSVSKSAGGLGTWASKFISKSFGKFTKLFTSLFYLAILLPLILALSYNVLTMALGINYDQNILIGILVVGPFVFGGLVFLSKSGSIFVNKIVTLIKIIPLIMMAFGGLFIIKNGGGLGMSRIADIGAHFGGENGISGVLLALPIVLFSFDAFLNVSNTLHNKEKDNAKVPKAIIFGMVFIAILYIFITISQINLNRSFVGTPSIYNTYTSHVDVATTFKSQNYQGALSALINNDGFSKFVLFTIFISGLGVANAIATAGNTSTQALLEEEFGISKKARLKGFILFTLVSIFLGGMIAIAEIKYNYNLGYYVLGSGDVIDNLSTWPPLFAFGLYSIVLISGVVNRKTKKVEVKKVKGFIPAAIISSTLVAIIIAYQIFYITIFKGSQDIYTHKLNIVSFCMYTGITISSILLIMASSRVVKKIRNHKKERA